jgi:Ca2+-binding RTX toxin-like protein
MATFNLGAGNNDFPGPGQDNTGNDTIRGDGGNDTLRGDGGNDRIFGGAGNDRLFGGEGYDDLYGGAGHDRLTGGPGQDYYIYNSAGEIRGDMITEFEDGEKIDLSNVAGVNTFAGLKNDAGQGEVVQIEANNGGFLTFEVDPVGHGNENEVRFEVDPDFPGNFYGGDFIV